MAEKQRLSESDTIILSLHDRWWGKVLAGEKPLEIRKTRPAGKGPYRVLVYVTGTGEIKGGICLQRFFENTDYPGNKGQGSTEGKLPDRAAVERVRRRERKALVGLVCVAGERILHATPVEPVRAEKTAAVLAVLQRGRRAGHYDNQSAC